MKQLAPAIAVLLTSLSAQDSQQKLNVTQLDTHAARVMKAFDVPGMAVTVVRGGKVLVAKGYGFRNVDKKLAVDQDTLFAIGSSSKAFTALGIALLVEDGKLSLSDPVRKHLPKFRMHDEYSTDHLTVEDLLCHRSGLPRHDLTWYGSARERRELVAALRWLEPSRPLRTTWQYQNLMFMTAGYLVGQTSSSTWESFTRKRILEPLGMQRSNFSVEISGADDNAAQPYKASNHVVEKMPFRNIDAVGPAGSINSTATDMAQWLRILLGKGLVDGDRVAKASTIANVLRPRVVMNGQRGGKEFGYMTYALGWMVQTYRGHMMVHHGGNIDGFSALVTLFPDDDIGVVVLTNLNGTPSTALIPRWVADHCFGLKPIDWVARTQKKLAAQKRKQAKAFGGSKPKDSKRVMGTKPSHALADYAGSFVHKGYGTLTVVAKDGKLSATLNGLTMNLGHYHYDVFESKQGRTKGTRLQFHTNLRGAVDSVSSKLEAMLDPIVFKRTAAERLTDVGFLGKLAGQYKLSGRTVEVELRGKTLFVTVPGQPSYECVPASGLRFDLKGLKGYSVVFKLDEASDKVLAVEFDQPQGVFKAKRVTSFK